MLQILQFDNPTVFNLNFALHILSMSITLLVALNTGRDKGILLISASDFCYAVGFFLMSSYDLFPDLVWEFVGNRVVDFASVVALAGMVVFLRRPAYYLLPGLLFLPAFALQFYYFAFDNYENMKAITIAEAGFRGTIALYTALVLMFRSDDSLRPASTWAGRFYVLWSMMLATRILYWLIYFDPGVTAPDADPTTTYALAARIMLTFMIAPCYIWMVTRRLDQEIRHQAITDPLTGVANRRRIWEVASRALDDAQRGSQPLSVLALDLDHFKLVNDTHGHAAGDQVLVAVAAAVSSALRSVDVLARVGGEEFAVLLPGTSLEGAQIVAERLKKAIAQISIACEGNVHLRVTTSIGVATAGRTTRTWDELIRKADRALYSAKQTGRNRVVAAE
ncbi:GGDEF domain-containing protein [Oryzibacter oryziterrae]|uniref:GGDEF domain-containing protein n=1 Tax=Oryzibacter oryziterrae TaxID=2766474 RepID=UPI001F302D5F|nr:GGDEF domain-containing protein [Oryzibacter oryziterrae]